MIELQCSCIADSIDALLSASMEVFRRDEDIRVVSQNQVGVATFSREECRGNATPFASKIDDSSTPYRQRLSRGSGRLRKSQVKVKVQLRKVQEG